MCHEHFRVGRRVSNLNFIISFPIFSIVLQRGGKQLVGDWSIDVLGKSENKDCALDTYNWFTFLTSHLAEDSRLSQCFIERDFSAGRSFCGSTSILKIDSVLLIRANSYFCYLWRGFLKKSWINRCLHPWIFFQLLFKVRSWMKFISQRNTFYGVYCCKAYPQNFNKGVDV